MNLSAFETYFPEHRPFFIEGGGLFSFGNLNCYFCSNVSNPNLFYSRRIGRRPQGRATRTARRGRMDSRTFPATPRSSAPRRSRAPSRPEWTLATLDAATARENATVDDGLGAALPRRGRTLQQLLRRPALARPHARLHSCAACSRRWCRDLADSTLRTQLTSHAEAAGVETNLWWGGQTYRWMGWADASQVTGSPAAILRLQRSSARWYFSDPTARSTATGSSPTGSTRRSPRCGATPFYSRLSKDAGDWLWEASTMVKSPGFESNDVGFSSQADRIWFERQRGPAGHQAQPLRPLDVVRPRPPDGVQLQRRPDRRAG